MRFLLTGFVGLLLAVSGLFAQGYSDYQVSGTLAPSYQCPDGYDGGMVGGGYMGGGGAAAYGGGAFAPMQPLFGGLRDRSSLYRTYPYGLAPYTRYGRIFGYTQRSFGGNENPYAGINPEAGNPYAGYTVTRGPRDFLMKNPPNIGP